jgi:hypothetical protein
VLPSRFPTDDFDFSVASCNPCKLAKEWKNAQIYLLPRVLVLLSGSPRQTPFEDHRAIAYVAPSYEQGQDLARDASEGQDFDCDTLTGFVRSRWA